ncbi:Protein CBG25899 [Caenorhabditis briggsae]|uniref:Protein CBG25899 n=1 Tax=Caenorhabditis briggsae TaxID=6238 RepID=B6IHK9_CAEBR|nr:Protein CBG25899 [Caenorhabditis briggsae]CAR99410.1 Protein CBG25899 [Caenorhabditis briggsae]
MYAFFLKPQMLSFPPFYPILSHFQIFNNSFFFFSRFFNPSSSFPQKFNRSESLHISCREHTVYPVSEQDLSVK